MNPDLDKAREGTLFKPGNTIQKQGEPWSIRKQQRYLAAQEVDPTQERPFEKALEGIPSITGAQLLAARSLDKALSGDTAAMKDAIENIDGKLTQVIDQTVTQKEAPTEFSTPEEAAAAYAEFIKK
jgi:hypothetical protein